MPTTIDNMHSNIRSIVVWDPLVRLIHWGLAVSILLNSTIVEDESKLHEWIGYVAVGLVGVRLIWGCIGTRYARFSAFPPNLFAARRYLMAAIKRDNIVHLSHNPLGALMAYNIWATVLLIGITGYMMGTVRFFGVGWVEEAHEIIFAWLLVSIALHIAGVFFDTWRSGIPLVRAMIDGRKSVSKDKTIE